jgi:hypothetical protein
VFICSSFQAFKWTPSEFSANRNMAHDGTLNLEGKITERIGLGDKIVL